MDIKTLEKACEKYKRDEGRASFYDVALDIADAYPLQASIIILATWNVGRFRFVASDARFLVNLEKSIHQCKPLFDRLKGNDFKNVNFDGIEDTVKKIYTTLSKVKGIEYTGASKVMHLLNRDLFVMWDKDTRDKYKFYDANASDYFNFLKLMQKTFGHIEWSAPNKTLAKAVDEFNQATITIPKRKQREKRNKKG